MNKRLVFLFLISLIASNAYSQRKLFEFYPSSSTLIDLSDTLQELYNSRDYLNSKLESEVVLDSTEKAKLDTLWWLLGEETSIYDIIGQGCSWYCSGGNDSVSSSSHLDSSNGYQYTASAANDLSYETAWIEGAEGIGIGEYLEYVFANKSPRVTEIIVSNGYFNNWDESEEFNRVKKLKLFVNGKPYGILNLQDSCTDQKFKIGLLGHNMDGSKLVLRFEILEVFSNNKSTKTAITEIYFNGIDVH